jgi:hypothetical protein
MDVPGKLVCQRCRTRNGEVRVHVRNAPFSAGYTPPEGL